MEVFSLEDEGNDLFITQQDKIVENSGILNDGMDFQSPCSGIVTGAIDAKYSDISDFESDVDVPSLQCNQNYR